MSSRRRHRSNNSIADNRSGTDGRTDMTNDDMRGSEQKMPYERTDNAASRQIDNTTKKVNAEHENGRIDSGSNKEPSTEKRSAAKRTSLTIDPAQDFLTEDEKKKIQEEYPFLTGKDLEGIYEQRVRTKALKRAVRESEAKEKNIGRESARDFNKNRNHTLIQVASHLVSNSQVAGFYNSGDDSKVRDAKMDELGEDIRRKYDLMTKIERQLERKVTEDEISAVVSILKH